MNFKKNKYDVLLEKFLVSKETMKLAGIHQFTISALNSASLEYNASLTGMQVMADRIMELETELKDLPTIEYSRKELKYDDALQIVANTHGISSETFMSLFGKGNDFEMADTRIKEATGIGLWEHVNNDFKGFEKVEEEPKYYVETDLGYFVTFRGSKQNPFFYEGTVDLKSANKFHDVLVAKSVAKLIKGNVGKLPKEVNNG